MNMISDYEAHKRDEETQMPSTAGVTCCVIHHTPFVAGVGIGGKRGATKYFGPDGGCAECFYQTAEWQAMLNATRA